MIHTTTTSTTTSTTTTTMNFKSRTAFKKTAARKTYDRCRAVRFHTQVAVYQKKYVANEATASSSSSSSSWLTMLEYGGIQTGVFDTLDQLRKNDRQASSSTVEYYCPRGLEDYCRTNHGALQPHVLARRKHVVAAVLHEQAAQQQQQQRRGRFQFPRENDVDDTTRLRRVSEASSRPHRHIAVTRGAVDSQAALTIYAEQQQQQHQPSPPHHNFPPHMQREVYQQYPPSSSQNVVTPPVTPKKCFQFNRVDELMLS